MYDVFFVCLFVCAVCRVALFNRRKSDAVSYCRLWSFLASEYLILLARIHICVACTWVVYVYSRYGWALCQQPIIARTPSETVG